MTSQPGQHYDYSDRTRRRHHHSTSEGHTGGAEGAHAESSSGSSALDPPFTAPPSMHSNFGQHRTADNYYGLSPEFTLEEMYELQHLGTPGMMPTINEDQDSQSTITPHTQSTSSVNADLTQASSFQNFAGGHRSSGFSTPSQTSDWTSSHGPNSPYRMEHPTPLPAPASASGSGFSTPSQSSESSFSHGVLSPNRIEPFTPLPSSTSHPGLPTNRGRSAYHQPSAQARMGSDSVSPTSGYVTLSFQNMKVRSHTDSPASTGSPFLSPISPVFPQGVGMPIPVTQSREAPRPGSSSIGRVDGFYNQFNSAPGPSSAPATLGTDRFGEQQQQQQLDIRPATYSRAEQIQAWKDIPWTSPIAQGDPRVFVPQKMYQPHTGADRRRYVEGLPLMPPVVFELKHPDQYGVSLADALGQRMKYLQDKDELMFVNCGPSASIRIEWPGMFSWSRQIPTKDFRSPPGPITKARLATQVARCVQRFINDNQRKPLHDEDNANAAIFRLGTGPHEIKFEDIILVSLHHVSQGSWQPHLRLRRKP